MTAGPLSPVREPREGERLLGDGPSAADHRWDAHRHDAEVGLEHHIWVENRHKRREVAITRGSEERVNGSFSCRYLYLRTAITRARTDPVRRSPGWIRPLRSSRRCSRVSDVDRRSQVP